MANTPKLRYAQGDNLSDTGATSIGAGDTSIQMSTIAKWSSDGGKVIIDRNTAEEEVVYASGKSGANLTITTDGRGLDGTSAQAHDSGATIESVPFSKDWNDLIASVLNILKVADGAVDNTKVPVVAGGYATTLTTTASTGVTLPTTGTLATLAGAETLTGKRIEPRIVSAASYTTDTGTSLSVATADLFIVTAQAGALKLNNPGGTPVQGQKLMVRIKDDGTARALTYDTQFRAMGTALPTTTVLGKVLYMGFIFDSTATKWDLVAAAQEA
jgi:hypothetical protein